MTLLAAFTAVLHRHTGATDIVVGTPVSTRSERAMQGVVGPCLNTLALRVDLSGDPPFRELLRRARATVLAAFEQQDAPFERVVQELGPERGGATPLFRAMLNVLKLPAPESSMAGAAVEPLAVDAGATVTDLTMIVDDAEAVGGVVDYNADLYEAGTIERFVLRLRLLLEAVAADPGTPLASVPLMDDDERRRLVLGCNDTDTDLAGPRLLHELVRRQASATPDAVAVAGDTATASYAELEQRSNALARRLHADGVGRGVVAGVLLDRTPLLAVAALAVLKAGGAFLPLDPDQPHERSRRMLADARARVVLTTRQRALGLSGLPCPILPVDEVPAPSRGDAPGPGDGAITPDDLAYVLYTSGSSGEPKGVLVPHGAICNQILWRQHAFPLGVADAVLAQTSTGFDPSVWELFGPLTAGARVVVPRAGRAHDPAYLVDLMARQRVTTLQLVPSMLEALLEEPGFERCHHLARVFCGGEPLRTDTVRRFFALGLAAELHHLYGPSEAAIDATVWTCRGTNAAPPSPSVTPSRTCACTSSTRSSGRLRSAWRARSSSAVPASLAGTSAAPR